MKRRPLLHAFAAVVLATTWPALAQPQYLSVFNSAQVESHCAFHRNSGRYRDGDHACREGISIRRGRQAASFLARVAKRTDPVAPGHDLRYHGAARHGRHRCFECACRSDRQR